MITFRRFYIHNFGRYVETEIDFAAGERPLTFIRGINRSGKTTLFRAMTWCVYGMPAMPIVDGSTHPVRPDFLPADEEVTTLGRLCFKVQEGDTRAYFRMTRATTTRVEQNNGQVIVVRGGDIRTGLTLERRDDDDWGDEAGYYNADNRREMLYGSFFREEYTSIVFADADEATEFVGGKGGSNRELMQERVTTIVRSLLSADRLGDVRQRRVKGHLLRAIREELDAQQSASEELLQCEQDVLRVAGEVDQAELKMSSAFAEAIRHYGRIQADRAAQNS